jgi:uncharacterized coiled-coil protein SlyX
MNQAIVEKLADTVAGQDKTIQELKDKMQALVEGQRDVPKIQGELEEVKAKASKPLLPYKLLQELHSLLQKNVAAMNAPQPAKVIYRHQLTNVIYLVIVLIGAVGLLSMGWYKTSDKLDQYKANDTKYRYLKLNDTKSLQRTLAAADSLYRVNPHLRDSVQEQEEWNQQQLEMLQEALQQEQNAKELREKAGRRK